MAKIEKKPAVKLAKHSKPTIALAAGDAVHAASRRWFSFLR
jgi:hypothetical protein